MHKGYIRAGALIGALSVALGAFAAHGLKAILAPDQLLIFETAVRYQFYHAFALIAVGIVHSVFPGKALLWSGRLFMIGVLLFSGSLYLLCYLKYLDPLSRPLAGAITPVGGLSFIAGWLLFAWALGSSKPVLKQDA